MSATVTELDSYRKEFEAATPRLLEDAPGWLAAARRNAFERFAERGFPMRREENWKYTDVRPIARRAFQVATQNGTGHRGEVELTSLGLGPNRLVFVDGGFSEGLSQLGEMPQRASIRSLSRILVDDGERVRGMLGSLADDSTSSFVNLNAAFAEEGAFIQIEDGVVLESPVELLFLWVHRGAPKACFPRILVAAGRGSRFALVEHYVGVVDSESLTNAVTEIDVGPGAEIEHYRVQHESATSFHVASVHARLAPGSRLVACAVDLGARLARADYIVDLAGEDAAASLNGLYVTGGRQHVDNHVRVDHVSPCTRSNQTYRGVLANRSRAVFNGKVVVHPGAQHADARQSNANLLFSENAEVDTKPELEIYADDVKCSHGATVGQLDEDAVFYLRSRGLDLPSARTALTLAFAEELIENFPNSCIRDALGQRVRKRLLALHRNGGVV